MMRTEAEILADLELARAAYQKAVDTQPRGVVDAASAGVRQLQAELAATLSAGAVSCPSCGQPPHGMLRRPAVPGTGRAPAAAALYEVGCTACGIRGQGFSPEAAVVEFNKTAPAAAPVGA